MQGDELLLTIAEVSVAFAGFASIVVLFVQGAPSTWPPSVAARLRAMVEISLVTLFSALFPFALFHLGASEPTVWSVSSALVGVALAVLLVVVFRRSAPYFDTGDLSRTFSYTVVATSAPVLGLQIANAVGAPFAPRFGVFLIAVLWCLLIASLMFIRLVVHPIARDAD